VDESILLAYIEAVIRAELQGRGRIQIRPIEAHHIKVLIHNQNLLATHGHILGKYLQDAHRRNENA
jgi:hypothetical protein